MNYGRGLYAHQNVVEWLKELSVPRESPHFRDFSTGIIGDLLGLPVFADPDMEPGDWLIRNSDGNVTDLGRIRSLSDEHAV